MDKSKLDILFKSAKDAGSEISFEETQAMFEASVLAGAGAASMWMKLVNTLKNPFIMMSITAIFIASLTLTFNSVTEPDAKAAASPETVPQEIPLSQPEPTSVQTMKQYPIAKSNDDNQSVINFVVEPKGESTLDETLLAKEPESGIQNQTLPTTNNDAFGGFIGQTTEAEQEEFVYEISNLTTEEEIKAIKKQAEKAGIDFSFKMKRGALRKLKMNVKSETHAYVSSLLFKGDFEATIGWVTDENGRFKDFYESDASKYFETFSEVYDEIEQSFDMLESDLAELITKESDLNNTLIDLYGLRGSIEYELTNIDTEYMDLALEELNTIRDKVNSLIPDDVMKMDTVYELQEEDPFRVAIDLSQKTTEDELMALKKRAEEAGLKVDLDYRYKGKTLVKLSISLVLVLEGENKSTMFDIRSGKHHTWNSIIAWEADENGMAVGFD